MPRPPDAEPSRARRRFTLRMVAGGAVLGRAAATAPAGFGAFARAASTLAIGAAATGARAADPYPTRAIRVILPHPPGGPSDMVMRVLAERLTASWKQPVVIENRAGAGGNIGAEAVARAAPDGYTWLVGTDTVTTINPYVYNRMGWRPDELQPVTQLTDFTQMLVCTPSLGVRTLAEFVQRARGTPRLSYASGGHAVPGHMAMEMFLAAAGVEMTHVPYKGPAPAMQDVMSGQVPCGFLATPTVWPQVQAGRLTALAISSARRSPVAANVPTVAEAGYPGFDASFTLALWLPRGTPDAVLRTISQEVVTTLRNPDVAARLAAGDQGPIANTPEEATARLAAAARRWGEVARRIDLKLD